jgi:hypothetical protein
MELKSSVPESADSEMAMVKTVALLLHPACQGGQQPQLCDEAHRQVGSMSVALEHTITCTNTFTNTNTNTNTNTYKPWLHLLSFMCLKLTDKRGSLYPTMYLLPGWTTASAGRSYL